MTGQALGAARRLHGAPHFELGAEPADGVLMGAQEDRTAPQQCRYSQEAESRDPRKAHPAPNCSAGRWAPFSSCEIWVQFSVPKSAVAGRLDETSCLGCACNPGLTHVLLIFLLLQPHASSLARLLERVGISHCVVVGDETRAYWKDVICGPVCKEGHRAGSACTIVESHVSSFILSCQLHGSHSDSHQIRFNGLPFFFLHH